MSRWGSLRDRFPSMLIAVWNKTDFFHPGVTQIGSLGVPGATKLCFPVVKSGHWCFKEFIKL